MKISRKDFKAYLRMKKMINDGCDEKDLMKRVRGINPRLIVRSDNNESKKYESMNEAAKDIGVSKQTLMYACKNDKRMITRRKDIAKAFYIEWI